jgi:hypothetical protein
MEFSTLKTEPTLEKEGVWKKYDDAEFRIAGVNSPAYQRALRRHGSGITSSKLKNDPAAQDKLLIEAMADAILQDWKGNVKMNGKQLPVTRENKIILLSIPVFRNWVAEQMQEIENFQAEKAAEEDAAAK